MELASTWALVATWAKMAAVVLTKTVQTEGKERDEGRRQEEERSILIAMQREMSNAAAGNGRGSRPLQEILRSERVRRINYTTLGWMQVTQTERSTGEEITTIRRMIRQFRSFQEPLRMPSLLELTNFTSIFFFSTAERAIKHCRSSGYIRN